MDINYLKDFPESKYYKDVCDKKQIVLHHTVSDPNNSRSDIEWWKSNNDHICTPFIINYDGEITQLYSSKYWSHHLGITRDFLREYGIGDYATRNVKLNKESIGIELDSWGGLIKVSDNKYKNAYNNIITLNDDEVQYFELGFRGYHYFQKYSVKQIKSLESLLIYLCDKYGISKVVDDNIWSVSDKAINSVNGIYAHVSYREDKNDIMPQPEILEMLIKLRLM